MIHKQLSNAARRFKQIFSEQLLNALGKSTRFCQRVREITPYRLALGLIEVFSTMRVETIADVHRGFNALCERKVQYKPFHNQLVKEGFPIFTRNLCERLMEQLTVEVLRFTPKSPFAKFSHILVHDGTSFGIKSALKKVYPGRFTKTSPAAVELHVSMDLLSEGLDLVPLTPDSESEVHHAPAPHTIAGGRFLGDRMFFNKPYLASIEAEGGSFVVKAKGNLNPIIRRVYTPEGREIKRYRNQPLAILKPKMGRYKALDLDVEWESELKARLVVTWNAKENKPRYLVTNRARGVYPR